MTSLTSSIFNQAQQAIHAQKHLWQQTAIELSQKDLLLPELVQLLQPISVGEKITSYALTPELIQIHSALKEPNEWDLILLALNPNIRKYWINLAIARCKEAQHMQDPMVLIQRIQALGEASDWLLKCAEDTTQLEATLLAKLERELIGCELHENVALPILLRILKFAYDLQASIKEVQVLYEMDKTHKAFETNWSAGRILVLPQAQGYSRNRWALQITAQQSTTYLDILNANPWLMLLALIGYTQDAWAAEHGAGFNLCLPQGQSHYAASDVKVHAIGEEGDEVVIGTLADLILKVLTTVGITCYPYGPTSRDLAQTLAGLIKQALELQLWQYRDGGMGELGQFSIHPVLSDACYSLPLSPIFGRKSKYIQQVIKDSVLELRQNYLLSKN
jgi:hypothetical protein